MKLAIFACASLLALTAAGSSVAQPAPPRDGPRMERPDPAAHAERRAEHLRAALQLRPDQEPALRAYLDTLGRPEGMHPEMRGARQAAQMMTTPQRLERQRARMAERQARFERHAAGTLRFYGALSPTQQRAFDAMRPGRGGGHGEMMRGGHGPMKNAPPR
ncbi:Spy/CpxP family protein refolding chaperone [Phenylobacterium sp.]|uniref:Spy/CpxP family protein refolding chaperone n=1 Tax=Phenylobacterium sp. TaxID=1871053 RepID=UPI003983CE41